MTRRYAPHLAEALVSAISVTGPDVDGNMQSWQLGTQAFDSLGRLTESASGGRITSYAYDGASPAPATVTLPSGSVLQYTYIPELGNAVSSLMAEGVMQNFRYDGTTGALLQADEGNTGKSNVWTPAGHLKTEISMRVTTAARPCTAAPCPAHRRRIPTLPVKRPPMNGMNSDGLSCFPMKR